MDVQVGATHATRMDLDDDLARLGARIGKRLQLPGLIELGDDGCAHGEFLLE
jgi:hypothetical protein